MPVKSDAQRRLMYAALKDPKGTGIPRSVAEKFVGPKAHAEGGTVKSIRNVGSVTKTGTPLEEASPFYRTPVGGRLAKGGMAKKESPAMAKKEVDFMKKKGAPKSMIKHEMAEAKGYAKGGSIDGVATKGKTKGKMIKMAMGGKAC